MTRRLVMLMLCLGAATVTARTVPYDYFGMVEGPLPPPEYFTPGVSRRFADVALTYRILGSSTSQLAVSARRATGVVSAIMASGTNPVPGFSLTEVPAADATADLTFFYGRSITLYGQTKTITKGALMAYEFTPGDPTTYQRMYVMAHPTSGAPTGLILHETAGHGFGVLLHGVNGTLWGKAGIQYTNSLTPAQNLLAHPEWQPLPGVYDVMRWIYHHAPGTVLP